MYGVIDIASHTYPISFTKVQKRLIGERPRSTNHCSSEAWIIDDRDYGLGDEGLWHRLGIGAAGWLLASSQLRNSIFPNSHLPTNSLKMECHRRACVKSRGGG